MKEFFREFFLILGYISMVFGIAMIYRPAAFIIGGALLMWLCVPVGPVKIKNTDKKESVK